MRILLLAAFLFSFASLSAQHSIVGLWKAVDDEDNIAKCYIKIYEKNGKYYGKVTDLLQRPDDTVCPDCPGELKNQPIVGMDILTGLRPHKNYWSYGKILDPEDGRIYDANVYLESRDKLRLRGYLGTPMIGRSQYWYRVK